MISSLASIDKTLFIIINSFNFTWLNPVMIFLSGQLIWLPIIIGIFFMAWKNTSRQQFLLFSLFLVLALIASDVTSSYILKNLFSRLRPCREEDLLPFIYQFKQKCGGKFGFVSSHAANTFAIVVFSFSSIDFRNKFWRFIWLMPILVSYSRIYLGSHYPGDILGGIVVGLFWGSFLAWILKNSRVRA